MIIYRGRYTHAPKIYIIIRLGRRLIYNYYIINRLNLQQN